MVGYYRIRWILPVRRSRARQQAVCQCRRCSAARSWAGHHVRDGGADLGAAVFFGVATVMQAAAARAADTGVAGVDPRLLVRLLGQWRFLAGIGLDLVGFLAELAALRNLPLFVVQAAVASSLAVTAVAATAMVGAVLSGREWAAVAAVCAGLALLGLSAGTESADP